VWFLRTPFVAAGVFLAASLIWKTLALHDLQPLISLYGAIGARWHVSEADLRQFAGTQLPAYFGHFALGILCGPAWLTQRGRVPGRKSAVQLGLLAAGAVLAVYAILAGHAAWLGEYGWTLITVLLATVLWTAVSNQPSWGEKLLGFAPLTYVGRVNYSMYLYHLAIPLLFNKYAPAALAGLTFPCCFTVMVVTSAASFHFIERPIMRRPKRGTFPEPDSSTRVD